eukprot:366067-Chlamydomonas_euryale.AAC.14
MCRGPCVSVRTGRPSRVEHLLLGACKRVCFGAVEEESGGYGAPCTFTLREGSCSWRTSAAPATHARAAVLGAGGAATTAGGAAQCRDLLFAHPPARLTSSPTHVLRTDGRRCGATGACVRRGAGLRP